MRPSSKSRRRSVATLLFAIVQVAAQTPTSLAAQIDRAPLEILYGFTLIDGLGEAPVPDAAVAIRADRVVATGRRVELLGALAPSEDPVLVDLGGGYLIPGLIDAHVHLATAPDRLAAEAELARMLRGGITAVRDMAGDARFLGALARDTGAGVVEGPDIYYSALFAGPSFFVDPRTRASTVGVVAGDVPWMQAIEPETDLVIAVAMARGTSASGLKLYANLTAAEVRAITEEAHRQGMAVWAHATVFPARPLEVAEAGVDVMSHACDLAWEAMADVPTSYHEEGLPGYDRFSADAPVFDRLFEAMRRHDVVLDATLARNQEDETCPLDVASALVRRARERGVAVVAGTDFTTPVDDPYPALHQELEALVKHAGFSPMEAIEAATRIGARALGAQDRTGTIQPGMQVDMVLLELDPTQDIANLRTVRAVWKNAVRYSVP